MTENKTLKRKVRARMTKTGERYTAARRQMLAKSPTAEPLAAPAAPPADPAAPPSTGIPAEPLHGPTNRPLGAWFALLDERGASDWKHRDIAVFLSEEGVPPWWTQDITVRYEKHIGRRVTSQRGSTFSSTGSKTISVPVASALDAWLDESMRARWLPNVQLRLRSARTAAEVRYKTARFDVNDGEGRVIVSFDPKGEGRTSVAIEHEKLPNAESASVWKTFWRERLVVLKKLLEVTPRER